jgi:stage V sporulation protein AF
MPHLSSSYSENVSTLDRLLRVRESFDIIKKPLQVGSDEVTFYYIDGFVKDGVMQKLMLSFTSLKDLGDKHLQGFACANDFLCKRVVYVESELTDSLDTMIQMVLSGATLMIGSRFGEYGILIDSRSYPARETTEPQNDRVMRGPRDGFVETLISNTALIRRRVRSTALTMSYFTVGKSSKTDVVLCFMADRADAQYVKRVSERLKEIKTESLTMGHQSLAECLIRTRWYNPFPKIRTTERPDVAAAQLFEGSVLILMDNSPEAMILPTSIFDFMQESNDFYSPPLTGTYIRIVRYLIFALTLFAVPVWYLCYANPTLVPDWFAFVLPSETGRLPVLAQLLIVEFVVDGLKMASMNTPDMLSNSLSVVGGLILGDFAVGVGWLIPEVIILMAFVAIANFSQRSYELGYAFKFMRILLLIGVALFGLWGFIGGVVLIIVLIATNRTVNGECSYLYPLIPFNARAFVSVFFRVKKKDVAITPKHAQSRE